MKIIGKFLPNGRVIFVIVIAFVMMLVSQITFAQDRWSFEFRPGINFATRKLGDADLKAGFGFEGAFSYRFMHDLSVYAGWSWNKLASDQLLSGTQLDFEETGYTYGLQFIHPIGGPKINILARLGGMSNHIDVETRRQNHCRFRTWVGLAA